MKNFEGLDLGKLDKVCDYIATFHYWYEILKSDEFFHYWSSYCYNCCYFLFEITFQTSDSFAASYAAELYDRSLNWKVIYIFGTYNFLINDTECGSKYGKSCFRISNGFKQSLLCLFY